MKIIRLSAAMLLVIGTATSSFAALSKEYADFAKGPYQYLLTNDEKKQWSAIKTDEAAKQFIDLFWARRDPTPTSRQSGGSVLTTVPWSGAATGAGG